MVSQERRRRTIMKELERVSGAIASAKEGPGPRLEKIDVDAARSSRRRSWM